MSDNATATPMTEVWTFILCSECHRQLDIASSCCPMQTGEFPTDVQGCFAGCWQKKRVPFSGTTFVDVREDEVRG